MMRGYECATTGWSIVALWPVGAVHAASMNDYSARDRLYLVADAEGEFGRRADGPCAALCAVFKDALGFLLTRILAEGGGASRDSG